MITEQAFLEKWRSLPSEQQQEVLNFMNYLFWREQSILQTPTHKTSEQSRSTSSLGQRLRQLRAEILTSGAPLLDWDDIAREKVERQGGYQENA